MTQTHPISATQRAKLREADLAIQAAVSRRDLILEVMLAQHDVTEGHVTGLTDEGIEVTTPDPISLSPVDG